MSHLQFEKFVIPPFPFNTFRVKDDKGDDAKATIARGINKRGVVVGNSTWNDGTSHGFRLNTDGTIDSIDPVVDGNRLQIGKKDVEKLYANGINDDGYIVGYFKVLNQNEEYGYRLNPFDPGSAQKEFTLIDVRDFKPTLANEPDADKNFCTNAMCINNDKSIGGRYFFGPQYGLTKSKKIRGFLLTGGTDKVVGKDIQRIVVQPNFTEVYGINSQSDLVGIAQYEPFGWFGFIIRTESNIAVPQVAQILTNKMWTLSRARGVSSERRVVGQWSWDGTEVSSKGHGFFWDVDAETETTNMIDVWLTRTSILKRPQIDLIAGSTYAHGINDDNIIVGEYQETFGQGSPIYAFILNSNAWTAWMNWAGLSSRLGNILRSAVGP